MGSCHDKAFATFVNDRKVADQPIDLIEAVSPAGDFAYRFDTPVGV